MVYYGILSIGGNEFGPVHYLEMLVIYLIILSSIIFNNLILSDVATLIATFQFKQMERQKQLDNANNIMIYIDLKQEKQWEVREFIAKTQATKELQQEFDQFFEIISPSLKVSIQSNIFKNVLMTNKVLNKLLVFLKIKEIKALRKYKPRSKQQETVFR